MMTVEVDGKKLEILGCTVLHFHLSKDNTRVFQFTMLLMQEAALQFYRQFPNDMYQVHPQTNIKTVIVTIGLEVAIKPGFAEFLTPEQFALCAAHRLKGT